MRRQLILWEDEVVRRKGWGWGEEWDIEDWVWQSDVDREDIYTNADENMILKAITNAIKTRQHNMT